MSDYQLIERIPTVAEFCDLRPLSGLTPKSPEPAALGRLVVLHFGRVIGDGGTVYQLTDIAVLAAHRGKGLGKRIVAALVDWLQANAPKGAYVSLIADGPAKDLYAQYGFEETAPASVGMSMWVR